MAGWNVTNVTEVVTNITSDCAVAETQGVPAAFHPDSVVSAQAEDLVRRWKDLVFLPVLVLIGGPANLINMAVFYKQGLRERINVCLFALSIADFLYLLEIIVFLGENIQLDKEPGFGPVAAYMINHNLIGFYGFAWVSQTISAFIASERCFCVLQPLRSQTVLRTSTTVVIIVVVNVVVVGLYFFAVTRYRAEYMCDPTSGFSLISLVPSEFYINHQALFDYLDVSVFGVGLPGLATAVVTTTTIVTTMKLIQAAAWRAGTSSSSSSSSTQTSSGMSSKEVALTKMLIGTSILFLICVFPNVVFRFAWLFLPELNVGRSQQNLFMVCLWVLDVVSWVNSSFNILVYYTMGSRYRATLWQLLGRRVKVQGSEATKAPKFSFTRMTDS